MTSELKQYSADHRYLLSEVCRVTGFTQPIALDMDEFYAPVVKAAKRKDLQAIDGVLVRDWDPDNRRTASGIQMGMRIYEIEGVLFVRVRFIHNDHHNCWALDFVAVDGKDYRKFYRIALKCRRDDEPHSVQPVLPKDQLELLWQNTIGYLEGGNLERIKAYGGRARRGVLLTGSPGNGKTMACRWIWEAARQRRWEYRLVTPDNYRQARAHDTIEDLFSVEKRGIVFFDDMDLALRDRDKIAETEDQAVFLSAMDGIQVNEGVVFVFTTNCSLDLIDKAFKRPGRLDLVLHFKAPDAALRRELLSRWHKDIREGIDLEEAVRSSEGYSFAEIEELKNLLVMHFMDCEKWDWHWAIKQFAINRNELTNRPQRPMGFTNHTTSKKGEEIPF